MPTPPQLPTTGEIEAKESPAERAARKRAKAVAHLEKEALLLLRDALCATLNLSGAVYAQAGLCRHSLKSLIALWSTPRELLAHLTTTAAADEIHSMVGGILANLATYKGNRNAMYKAELQLKIAACGGSKGFSEHLPALDLELDWPPSADEGEAEESEAAGPVDGGVDSGDASAKARFLHWLETTAAERTPGDQLNEITSISHEEAERAVAKAESLANEAFVLIDRAEEGSLTLMEVIRAFRCDERVRQTLLPLLPQPKGTRWSSSAPSATEIAEQCDAFEALFDSLGIAVSDEMTAATLAALFASRAEARAYRDHVGLTALSSTTAAPSLSPRLHGIARARPPLEAAGQRTPRAGDSPAGRTLPPISAPHALTANRGEPPTKLGLASPRSCSVHLASPRGVSARANGGNSLKNQENFNELLRKSYSTTWEAPLDAGAPHQRQQASQHEAHARRAAAGSLQFAPSPRRSARAVAPLPAVSAGGLKAAAGEIEADVSSVPRPPLEPRGGSGASPTRHRVLSSPRAAARGADRWEPEILALHSESTRKTTNGEPAALTWEEEYLMSEAPLRFSVDLPPEEHYTKRFKFTGEGLSEAALATRMKEGGRIPASMFCWEATLGSRVGDMVGSAFKLADGRFVRLYHRPTRRNWRQAERDILPLPPDGLGSLHLDSLPALPPAPVPTRRDLPKLAQSIFLGAPSPSFHTLPVSSPDVWYGTIPREILQLGARRIVEPTPEVEVQPELGETAELTPWLTTVELEESIFAPRKQESDGRSFFTPDSLTARAFDIDWSRLNSERFRNFIGKEDDDGIEGVDDEMAEVKEVLFRHRAAIYSAYAYYCVTAPIRVYDGFVLGCDSGLQIFAADTKILDDKSEHCKREHIKLLFMYANQEERRSTDPKQQLANQVNADRALLRSEFIQAIVRLAIAKYIKERRLRDVSDAVEALFKEYILPNLSPAALHKEDDFREKRLYMRNVAAVLEKYKKSLQNIFDHYCIKAAVRSHHPNISLCRLADGLLRVTRPLPRELRMHPSYPRVWLTATPHPPSTNLKCARLPKTNFANARNPGH